MDEDGVLMVFRCHNKMELAEKRCPAGAEPGVCAYGYEGSVCDGCIEGYGMSPARECEPCEGTGYTTQSMVVLICIFAGIFFVTYVFTNLWKVFSLKHFARCGKLTSNPPNACDSKCLSDRSLAITAFQPGRILITYSQITSQLGKYTSSPSGAWVLCRSSLTDCLPHLASPQVTFWTSNIPASLAA